MDKTVSIILPEEMLQAMREIAHKQSRSFGAVVRDAISQYLAGGVVVVPVRGLLDQNTRPPEAK